MMKAAKKLIQRYVDSVYFEYPFNVGLRRCK